MGVKATQQWRKRSLVRGFASTAEALCIAGAGLACTAVAAKTLQPAVNRGSQELACTEEQLAAGKDADEGGCSNDATAAASEASAGSDTTAAASETSAGSDTTATADTSDGLSAPASDTAGEAASAQASSGAVTDGTVDTRPASGQGQSTWASASTVVDVNEARSALDRAGTRLADARISGNEGEIANMEALVAQRQQEYDTARTANTSIVNTEAVHQAVEGVVLGDFAQQSTAGTVGQAAASLVPGLGVPTAVRDISANIERYRTGESSLGVAVVGMAGASLSALPGGKLAQVVAREAAPVVRTAVAEGRALLTGERAAVTAATETGAAVAATETRVATNAATAGERAATTETNRVARATEAETSAMTQGLEQLGNNGSSRVLTNAMRDAGRTLSTEESRAVEREIVSRYNALPAFTNNGVGRTWMGVTQDVARDRYGVDLKAVGQRWVEDGSSKTTYKAR